MATTIGSCGHGLVRVLLGAAVVAAAVGGGGCGRAKPKLAAGGPPEVVVSKPVVASVTDYEDFTGRTEAYESVEIRARVTGYLTKAFFKEGADVKEGQPLIEIDQSTYKAALAQAEANVEKADALFRRLTADYERAAKLLPGWAISREELERIAGDRSEARASVAAAKAARDLAKLNLGFTTVRAPFAGRISRRYADPGNLVKADETMLTSIVALDPMYAYFDIDERTLLRLRRLVAQGKLKRASDENPIHVQVGLADERDFSLTGKINFVDNRLDPGTGTLRARVAIANPKLLLSPGLFVRVRLPIGAAHPAVLVPEQALGTDQGQKFVYVLNADDEVVYRRVQVGLLHQGRRAIEEGVSPSDRVIITGLQRVRPGVKVTPKAPEPSSESAARGPSRTRPKS